jgi:hypothetical protein
LTRNRKIATFASSWGNICTSRMVSSPGRRPTKRSRENAYAAMADRNMLVSAAPPAILSELPIQVQNGVLANSSR